MLLHTVSDDTGVITIMSVRAGITWKEITNSLLIDSNENTKIQLINIQNVTVQLDECFLWEMDETKTK